MFRHSQNHGPAVLFYFLHVSIQDFVFSLALVALKRREAVNLFGFWEEVLIVSPNQL